MFETPRSMFPALPVNMRPVLLLRVASRMEPKRSMIWGMLVNIIQSVAAVGPLKHWSSAAITRRDGNG